MKPPRAPVASLLAFCASLPLGCAHTSSPGRVTSADAITIVSASPQFGTTLTKGGHVLVEVAVDYVLSSVPEGEVVLVLFVPSTGRNVVDPQPAVAVNRGVGRVSLAAQFEVPADTDRVGLSVILTGERREARTAHSRPAAQRIEFFPVR